MGKWLQQWKRLPKDPQSFVASWFLGKGDSDYPRREEVKEVGGMSCHSLTK